MLQLMTAVVKGARSWTISKASLCVSDSFKTGIYSPPILPGLCHQFSIDLVCFG